MMLFRSPLSVLRLSLLAAGLVFGICALSPSPAMAACTTPDGGAGKIVYNATAKTFQYCNDTQWVAMNQPGSGAGGCSNPPMAEGEMVYNAAHRVMQGCAGNVHQAMGAVGGGVSWDSLARTGGHVSGEICGIKNDGTGWCWSTGTPSQVPGGGTWKTLTVSEWHGCGIKPDDTLWCWDQNEVGQLGDGTTTDRVNPVEVSGGGTWKHVAAGGSGFNRPAHTCGIKSDDTLWCWGDNTVGQLGDGTTTQRNVPTAVSGGGTWKYVAAGGDSNDAHTCGVKTDGSLFCWGVNSSGQLGDTTTTTRNVPTAVSGGGLWKTVHAGSRHTCGIKADDTVWCWGYNLRGQLGDNSTTQRTAPVAVNGGGAWKMVVLAWRHTCGIKSDDTLWCWGENEGQLGDGTTTQRNVPTAISGGGTWKTVSAIRYLTCAISMDGARWCWGSSYSAGPTATSVNFPVPIADTDAWKQVAAGHGHSGQHHTCAIRSNDTLWCWGSNDEGQLGDNTTVDKPLPAAINGGGTWKQVAVGETHSCGIKSDDTLWCWGYNGDRALGDGTSTDRLVPTAVSGGGTWKKVQTYISHTCGIKSDDTLWCWGRNTSGQLGDGTTTTRSVPTAVSGGGTWKVVTMSDGHGTHTCGIKTDDSLWCWGNNAWGQVGDGTTTQRTVPTAVSGGGTWKYVAAGGFRGTACAIKTDDTLWCWGYNSYAQIGDNTSTDRNIPTAVSGGGTWKDVSLGENHTCAIKFDDTLWCWGQESYGELGHNGTIAYGDTDIPGKVDGYYKWKGVSAGGNYTCAINLDGLSKIYCWGANGESQQTPNDYTAFVGATVPTDAGACITPYAKPGTMLYNTTQNRLQYCDGVGWVSVGGNE